MIFVFTFAIPERFLHSLPAGFKNTFTIEIYTQIEITLRQNLLYLWTALSWNVDDVHSTFDGRF